MGKVDTIYRRKRSGVLARYKNGTRETKIYTPHTLTQREIWLRPYRLQDRTWAIMEYFERFSPSLNWSYWDEADWSPIEEDNGRYWREDILSSRNR